MREPNPVLLRSSNRLLRNPSTNICESRNSLFSGQRDSHHATVIVCDTRAVLIGFPGKSDGCAPHMSYIALGRVCVARAASWRPTLSNQTCVMLRKQWRGWTSNRTRYNRFRRPRTQYVHYLVARVHNTEETQSSVQQEQQSSGRILMIDTERFNVETTKHTCSGM